MGGGPVLTHAGTNVVNFAEVWLLPNKKTALMSTSNIGREIGSKSTYEAIDALINQL